MRDFGEPWRLRLADHLIVTRFDEAAFAYAVAEERMLACVNALAGIDDPAAQVERWKATEVLLRRHGRGIDPAELLELTPSQIEALAAEWKPDAGA